MGIVVFIKGLNEVSFPPLPVQAQFDIFRVVGKKSCRILAKPPLLYKIIIM